LRSRKLCSHSGLSKHFIKLEDSLPCSQEPSTDPYPEPDQSRPYYPILSLFTSILILYTDLRLGLPSGLYPSGFPTNTLYAFLLSPILATCPAHIILLNLIILINLAKSTSYEAPYYAVFSNLLPVHPSSVQIFSSTPSLQTPSVYVPLLISVTKYHTHTKPHAKL
jgi:hypothetical protein